MSRIIGIRHRVKELAVDVTIATEAGDEPVKKLLLHPTMVAITDGDERRTHELATETDELDFLLNRFPTAYRPAAEGEDLSAFLKHQLKERKQGDHKITMVPIAFEGLRAGDTVGMVLGGSGDRFAYALSRRSEEIGAEVRRIPPFQLKQQRPDTDKEQDHVLLATLAAARPDLFQTVTPRDRLLIFLTEAFRARQEAIKARIACQQRLRQRLIGEIFLSDEGRYPDGNIEDIYDAAKADDVILSNLEKEERRRDADLKQAVEALDVWQLFDSVEGVGPTIAAGLITAIRDIRRFDSADKLKAYLGVHLRSDGKFVRRRSGEVANWNGAGRQALYLVVDQFNRRPKSEWGLKLRANKAHFRVVHPEAIQIDVTDKETKKTRKVWRYNDGHIHKMGLWRTATQFVVWLYDAWTALEAENTRRERESEQKTG